MSVYIVDGCRTPFLKARGKPGPFAAADLLTMASKTLLLRQPFVPTDVDEMVTGCVMANAEEANISRVVALRVGCGDNMPAWTVQRNCASGMQAVDAASQAILLGRADLVLVGGTEAMSRAPLLYSPKMTLWFSQWMAARNIGQRVKVLAQFRLSYLAPVIALLRGLTDPVVGLSMGQTAENLAYQFGITREQMDQFAVQSHQRLATAQENNYLSEIIPIYDNLGKLYATDDGLRTDSNIEKLATLKPFFDKKYGMVTAANSSQVTDGAVAMILASKQAVEQYQLPVLGKIVDVEWAALNPAQMGLGPIHAATPLLQRHQLTISDIDYWEINEAFAAQVLACIEAWADADYCQQQLGLSAAMGKIPLDRLNVDGGAIALGHPVGASGARIILHLLHVLKRQQAQRGLASICIGGGQGGAVLLERL